MSYAQGGQQSAVLSRWTVVQREPQCKSETDFSK